MASPYELTWEVDDKTLTNGTFEETRTYLINFYNVAEVKMRILVTKDTTPTVISKIYILTIKYKTGELLEFEAIENVNNVTAITNLYDAFKIFAPAL